MTKKCIVSFADATGSYQKKMQRLQQSLPGNFDGDFLGFTSYTQIGSPPHLGPGSIPYAFKAYAIKAAIEQGYEVILWCDSPVYAKKDTKNLFWHLEKTGYLFFDNIGYSLGDYTNDRTLEHFGITRQESWSIKMIMACCMGFDMRDDFAKKMFQEYFDLQDLYKGEWDNDDLTESLDLRVKGNRHDQSVMSCIIHKYGAKILKGQDTFFSYESHRQVMKIDESVCLFSA